MSAVHTDEAVETSDLDLLDDTRRHARCCICTGTHDDLIGVTFIALCGRRAINLRTWSDPFCAPPDACPDCLELFAKGCPRCGVPAFGGEDS